MRKVTRVPDKLPPDLPPEPANLRLLRRLVTVLTAVMIAGLIAVVAALVIGLRDLGGGGMALPEAMALPPGVVPYAVTRTPREWIVVDEAGRVLVLAPDGRLLRDVAPAE